MVSIEIISGKYIVLQIQEIGLYEQADAYYFVIDPSVEGISIGKSVSLLLDSWVSCLKQVLDRKTVYLPFDFSDQYIGYLKVTLRQDVTLILSYGYSHEIEGWAISPSNLQDCIELKQFIRTSDEISTTYDLLLQNLLQEKSKF